MWKLLFKDSMAIAWQQLKLLALWVDHLKFTVLILAFLKSSLSVLGPYSLMIQNQCNQAFQEFLLPMFWTCFHLAHLVLVQVS